MSGDTLILGMAAGYHYGDVRPFLASLEQSGHTGKCVLFTSKTTRDLDRIRKHGVEVVPFTRPAGLKHVPYNALRYFLYHDYLTSSGRIFVHILMTDVRDVIFQRDPFDYPWPDGLNCTLEDRRMTVGQCPHNSRWIRGHFGNDALKAVADKPISCSGTTVGDYETITAYLDALTGELESFTPGERMAGVDQGIHNILLHTGRLPCVTTHDNTGPIITLGYVKDDPTVSDQGHVLNGKGIPAYMVHQYDRKPALFKFIRNAFA